MDGKHFSLVIRDSSVSLSHLENNLLSGWKMGDQDINYSLISAVREGRLEKARELINSFGLSYSESWSGGYALLCDAVKYKHAAVVELLLTSGSRVNSMNKIPSNTPLHLGVINGDIEIVKMILDKGANIDANAKDRYGTTPLHIATKNKNIEITELLLKHRADVNAGDKDGTTPLHVAAEIGCLQIVEHLLNYGAYVDCVTRKKGYAPLHFAVEKRFKEVVTLLLSSGANVDIKGVGSITPLHIAFELGDEEVVKLLLNRGADVNASKKGNLTLLHIATKTGHETFVKLLLQHGAKVDNQNKRNKTILQLAVEKRNLTIVKEVLKYCPDIYDKSNRSCLKIAVHHSGEESKKIVEALLEYGLMVNPQEKNNPKLLHAAVEKGYLKIIEDLLKYGADVNMSYESYDSKYFTGFTPLHRAAHYKQEEVANLLISYGADINARDSSGKTPIFYAIENTNIKMTKLLLQHDADINASDEHGRTALHYTAFSKYFFGNKDPHFNDRGEIAKLLLSKGANVDAQTKNGVTTLHDAVEKGYAKVVEALLEYNANVNSGVKTPLHLSTQIGYKEIIIMLLNKGANVNAKQQDGTTALHIASKKFHHEHIVIVLLECGADINSRDKYGRTALHLASEEGHVDVVQTLLEYGSDINITSRNNHTPLDDAMDGIARYYRPIDDYFYYPERSVSDSDRGALSCETAEILKRHIVKMETANLYISEKVLLSMRSSRELCDFQNECKKEIASMKSEKINDLKNSFYDILAKGTNSLAIYMRNENIVQVLKSNNYKTKFPIYASMIENNIRKGIERKELLEQGNKIFHFLLKNFSELPYNCTEKIFSYLSDADLRILMDVCKALSISNLNTN